MRVLLASYFSLPSVTGLYTYIDQLKKALEQQGHHVDLLAQTPSGKQLYLVGRDKLVDKSEVKHSVEQLVQSYFELNLPSVDQWIRRMEIERYTFELCASLFDLHQYDVIHAQDILSARSLSRVKPAHSALIASIHGIYSKELIYYGQITDRESTSYKYMEISEFNGAISPLLTIVPTNWMKQELVSTFQIPMNKLKVVPYGMDLPLFLTQMDNDPHPPVHTPRDKFIIACLARLDPVKGHKTLIEALHFLHETRTDFVCWLIGGCFASQNQLKDDLENDCKRYNLADHVIFLGNRRDVPSLLKQSDMVVLPSVQDNHPFALMEAQTAGKAIVASNAGGIPEMILHGKTGLLFEKQNPSELAEQLLKIMDTPKLRRELEINSKYFAAKKWSLNLLYNQISNIYNQAVAVVNSCKNEEAGLECSTKYGLPILLPADYELPDPGNLKSFLAEEFQ